MGGLWKQLDHQKSASRDKVEKPDYRENFTIPAIQQLPCSLLNDLPIRISASGKITRTPTWYRELRRKWQDQIKRELRRITNRHPVVIQDKKFSFKWGEKEFASKNTLSRDGAEKCYKLVKKEAHERREMVENRLKKGDLERKSEFDEEQGRDVEVLELKFGLKDVKQFLRFADDFEIEDEFFATPVSGTEKSQCDEQNRQGDL